MSQDLEWTMEVEKPAVQTEQVVAQVKELALVIPTPNRLGVVVVVMGARDAEGNFREDITDKVWRVVDSPGIPGTPATPAVLDAAGNVVTPEIPGTPDTPPDYTASLFIDLIFNSLVPENEQTVAMGIAGRTVLEAGTMIVRNALAVEAAALAASASGG